jgi:putative SOS response-associated peptidase YedK
VVPADGFYEWTGERSARHPIWFHTPGGGPLFMAGIFDAADPPSFAVLTTAARPPVAELHDRMPVLLNREGARRWLLGQPPRVATGDDVPLAARPVSPRANAVAHDDPSCLEPASEADRLRLAEADRLRLAGGKKQLDLF